MKFSIRKNEDGSGASSKLMPQSSPASTVASSGSKCSFSSPLTDSKVNKSTTSGKGSTMSAKSLAQRSKGDAFVQEADATLKKSALTPSFTKKKNGRAAESLKNAAEAYKAGGFNDEAGKAYQRAAALHKDKLKNKVEASKCLSDAGECLKKSNPTESTRCYQSAAILLRDAGNLNDVATEVEVPAAAAAKLAAAKIESAGKKKSSKEAIKSTQGETKLLEKEKKLLEKENKSLGNDKKTLEKKNRSLKQKLIQKKPATAGLLTSGAIFNAKGKQTKKTGVRGFLHEMNK